MSNSAVIVHENDRSAFFPKHFGKMLMKAEQFMYTFSDKHLYGYDGGFWDYYELPNGGFFVRFNFEGTMRFSYPENYTECNVNAEEYGIIVTMFLISNAFTWPDRSKINELIDSRYAIMGYVDIMKPESRRKIFSAID